MDKCREEFEKEMRTFGFGEYENDFKINGFLHSSSFYLGNSFILPREQDSFYLGAKFILPRGRFILPREFIHLS